MAGDRRPRSEAESPERRPADDVESFRGEWKITRESAKHEPLPAFQAMWEVTVPAGGEASVEYRAQIGQR